MLAQGLCLVVGRQGPFTSSPLGCVAGLVVFTAHFASSNDFFCCTHNMLPLLLLLLLFRSCCSLCTWHAASATTLQQPKRSAAPAPAVAAAALPTACSSSSRRTRSEHCTRLSQAATRSCQRCSSFCETSSACLPIQTLHLPGFQPRSRSWGCSS